MQVNRLPNNALVVALVTAICLIPMPSAAASGGNLFGTVSDGSGSPLGASTVTLYQPGSSTVVTATTTASDGRYTAAVNDGFYDVTIDPPDGSGFHSATFGNVGVSGPTRLDVHLSNATLVSFSGVVRSDRGVVLPEALVALRGPTDFLTRSGADGSFRLAVPAGNYALQVDVGCSPGCAAGVKFYQGNTPKFAITGDMVRDLVVPTAQVSVTVVDDTGAVVPGARVETEAYYPDPASLFPGHDPGSAQTGWPSVSAAADPRVTDAAGRAVLTTIPVTRDYTTIGMPTPKIVVTPPADRPELAKTTLTDMRFTEGATVAVALQFEDSTPPDLSIDPLPRSSTPGDPITGTASDDVAGIASVMVQFTNSAGVSTTTTAVLSCVNSARSCRWTARLPSTVGRYTVRAVAQDRARHTAEATTDATVLPIRLPIPL